MGAHLVEDTAEVADRSQETAKRRQIIEGARAVFLTQGFDAASMGEIARRAGVSKGTLYCYFQSKEELFAVVVQGSCSMQAEALLALDPSDHDVEAVLTPLRPAHATVPSPPRRPSPLRT